MTDPSKKVYSSIHEALLDYARLGKKTYDEMELQKAKEELGERIEQLEARLDKQEEYQQEQNEI